MLLRAVIAFALCYPTVARAEINLAPFKDKYFNYPAILERTSNDKYWLVEYDRERDMIKRDKIPRRKANHWYVDRGVRWSRRVNSYASPNGKFKYFSVGKNNREARVVIVYVHGKGGNRRQGVNDWTFGGNFNRLQNLMVRNNGVLLTPDFTDFKDRGTSDITALISIAKRNSPRAKLIIACGSMGGGVCWRLMAKQEVAKRLDGVFFLGSFWNDAFLSSPTLRKNTRNIPIVIGHGASDPVFSPDTQKSFFDQILKKNPRYPARFVMFSTGAHGTPIRMIDWRTELNWMLSQN